MRSVRVSPVVLGYLRLARPANLPTAAADILAGIALSGILMISGDTASQLSAILQPGLLLVFSSVLLYAGGVVLNDVFDLRTDRIERPERPIPSGLVPVSVAAVYGGLLLLAGVVLAHLANPYSGLIAGGLLLSIVLYDAYFKRYSFLGPLSMGLCRGLNLLLGMSVAGSTGFWSYALIPVVYIFAITLISRGEVHGQNKKHILWAAVLYALVIFGVVYIMLNHPTNVVQVILFLGLFAFLVYKPLLNAYRINSAANIKKAVMAGVLSLIILDASLAAIMAPWWYPMLIILLWPLSRILAKLFAVT